MRVQHWKTSFGVMAVATALLAGCGGSTITSRGLQSITVSPSAADGSTSGGTVQFTATAHWSAAPFTTTPFGASWAVCQNNMPVKNVTVSNTGLAACGTGAQGVYDVNAWSFPINDGPTCMAINLCGTSCTVVGSAQLTCP